MIYVIGFDDLVKNLKPGTLNALLNEPPRDAKSGVTDVDGLELTQMIISVTTSVEHINDGFYMSQYIAMYLKVPTSKLELSPARSKRRGRNQ